MSDGPNDVEALRKVRFFEELTDEDLARVAKLRDEDIELASLG